MLRCSTACAESTRLGRAPRVHGEQVPFQCGAEPGPAWSWLGGWELGQLDKLRLAGPGQCPRGHFQGGFGCGMR